MGPSFAFAIGIALVMTVLLAALFLIVGFRFAAMRTFASLAATTWAGGHSLSPFGPELWGISWLSFVVTGFAAAAAYVGWAVLSRYLTRTVSEQLDSLAAGRRGIRAPIPDRVLTIESVRTSPLFGTKA